MIACFFILLLLLQQDMDLSLDDDADRVRQEEEDRKLAFEMQYGGGEELQPEPGTNKIHPVLCS